MTSNLFTDLLMSRFSCLNKNKIEIALLLVSGLGGMYILNIKVEKDNYETLIKNDNSFMILFILDRIVGPVDLLSV